MDFLPEGYRSPVGNYMKLEIGETTFRIMGSAIVGYEYWTNDNVCVRSRKEFMGTPKDIRVKDSKADRVKHFWAFPVWNVDAKKLQILEITQAGIQDAIKAYVANKKWGDPKGYDITISRAGSGLDTEYTIMANPHTPVETEALAAYEATPLNLQAMYDGEDPFAASDKEDTLTAPNKAEGEVSVDEEFEGMGAEPVVPRKPKALGGE